MSLTEVWRAGYDLIYDVIGIWFWMLPLITLFLFFGYRRKYPARQYKKENDIIYVKHGRGKWIPMFEHMKEKHPEEYATLGKQEEARNG